MNGNNTVLTGAVASNKGIPTLRKISSAIAFLAVSGVATDALAMQGYPTSIVNYCSSHGGLASAYSTGLNDLSQSDSFANYPNNAPCSACHYSGTDSAQVTAAAQNKSYYSGHKSAPDNFCAGIAVNNPPTVAVPSSSVSVVEGSPINFTVTATDPDSGDSVVSLTASGSAITAGATFNNGVFDWASPVAGDYVVTFTATDTKNATGTSTVNIHVTANQPVGNVAPVLMVPTGTQNVTVNKPISFTITATDADGDDVSLTATGMPADASLSPASQDPMSGKWSSTFTWTPTALPSPNPVSIIFTATDAPATGTALSTSQTVKIQVNQDQGGATLTALNFSKASWNSRYHKLSAAGYVKAPSGVKVRGMTVTISDLTSGAPVTLGTATVGSKGTWTFNKSLSSAPCTIEADAGGLTATRTVDRAPSSCTTGGGDDDRVSVSPAPAPTPVESDTETTTKSRKGKKKHG